jgi:Xaa-Pro aminopeptidase
LLVELDEACADIAATLARMVPGDAVLAADEIPFPLRRALADRVIADGAAVLGASRILKTPDELACLRMAQWLNELAMSSVQPLLQPGVRQCELTGSFLSRALELGASGIGIDTIWQVMPDRKASGPWAFHGDVAFPTPSADTILREGDVIWVDSGIFYEGYASDRPDLAGRRGPQPAAARAVPALDGGDERGPGQGQAGRHRRRLVPRGPQRRPRQRG